MAIFQYIEAVETIKEINIFKGDRFYIEENGEIRSMKSDKILPSYININSAFFKEINIIRDYVPGDYVKYKFIKDPYNKHKYNIFTGTVVGIFPKYMSIIRSGTNGIIDNIDYPNIISKETVYWFISSSGKVQSAVTGYDPNADTFRIKSNNTYISKDEAKNALEKILK